MAYKVLRAVIRDDVVKSYVFSCGKIPDKDYFEIGASQVSFKLDKNLTKKIKKISLPKV